VIFFSVGFPLRHSSWRASSRSGIRWLGVSTLVTGRVFSALASVRGISVSALAVAVIALNLIAVEVALAEKSPNAKPQNTAPSIGDIKNSDTDQPSSEFAPSDRDLARRR
jgi:hypothetical protein